MSISPLAGHSPYLLSLGIIQIAGQIQSLKKKVRLKGCNRQFIKKKKKKRSQATKYYLPLWNPSSDFDLASVDRNAILGAYPNALNGVDDCIVCTIAHPNTIVPISASADPLLCKIQGISIENIGGADGVRGERRDKVEVAVVDVRVEWAVCSNFKLAITTIRDNERILIKI